MQIDVVGYTPDHDLEEEMYLIRVMEFSPITRNQSNILALFMPLCLKIPEQKPELAFAKL